MRIRRRAQKPRRLVMAAALLLTFGLGTSQLVQLASAEGVAEGIEKSAGAAKSTNYPIPDDAVFVSPNGQPNAAGTKEQPILMLEQALKNVRSGGTIVMRGGTYRQAIPYAVEKPVTIQAYPGEQPVMSGADEWKTWVKTEAGWMADEWTSPFGQSDYDTKEIRPEFPLAGKVEQVFRNGSRLRQVASTTDLKGNTFFFDPSTKKVTVAEDPKGATMEISTREMAITFAATEPGTAIKGITFTSYTTPQLYGKGTIIANTKDMLLEHVTVRNSAGPGAYFQSKGGLKVVSSTFEENGSAGMTIDESSGTIVEKSVFRRNNSEHFKVESCVGPCAVAGLKVTRSTGTQVLNSAFAENDSDGLSLDVKSANTMINNNVSRKNGRAGITYALSSGGAILHNHIIENAIEGILVSGSQDVSMRDNIVVNNKIQFRVVDDARANAEKNTQAKPDATEAADDGTAASNGDRRYDYSDDSPKIDNMLSGNGYSGGSNNFNGESVNFRHIAYTPDGEAAAAASTVTTPTTIATPTSTTIAAAEIPSSNTNNNAVMTGTPSARIDISNNDVKSGANTTLMLGTNNVTDITFSSLASNRVLGKQDIEWVKAGTSQTFQLMVDFTKATGLGFGIASDAPAETTAPATVTPPVATTPPTTAVTPSTVAPNTVPPKTTSPPATTAVPKPGVTTPPGISFATPPLQKFLSQ